MNEKENNALFPEDIKKVVSFVLLFILVFSAGNIIGSLIKTKKTVFSSDFQQAAVTTTQAPVNSTVQNIAQSTTAAVTAQQNSDEKESTSAPLKAEDSVMSTQEIIELFNKSANTVKTDAVKVVKNFEKRKHNKEHLIVPSVVESMANNLMEENFKDDTEPIEYLTREEIVAKYQVPGVEWSSCLTQSEVESAVCIDNGTEYEIEIRLYPTENPEPGIGVAKAFDTITSSEIMAEAPDFVKDFSTTYTDCVVRCRIDKQTGKTVWSNYNSTVVVKVILEFLGNELDAQVGMSFEKDYTITY